MVLDKDGLSFILNRQKIIKNYIFGDINMRDLNHKKGLIIGIANEDSIAYGCAKSLREYGCTQIIATYLNDKAYSHVKNACEKLDITDLVEFNFSDEASVAKLFEVVSQKFGEIDFVIHAMAFADKESLHGRVVDCKWDGFASSLQISSYSLIAVCRHAEKLMPHGGSILTMSYIGATRVIPHYGIMGPIKACLESTVKYLANELAPQGIRVFAISPGTIMTRASSGISGFNEMLENAISHSPMKRLVTQEEVGGLSAFLISDLASGMTGQTIYVDAGYSLVE